MKILILNIFLFLLLFTSSCKDFLDDPQPVDSLPTEFAFQNAQDLEAALVGVYDALQSGDLLGRNLIAFPDLIGHNNNYRDGGAFTLFAISTLQMESNDVFAEDIWVRAYGAINQLNQILAALPDVVLKDPGITTDQANRIQGEALLLRGVLYFELVRLFALPYDELFLEKPGVPLMLDPVIRTSNLQYPARATISTVYRQINNDLSAAKELLPEENDRGRVQYYSALAYQARVAFQQRDYSRAAGFARELITNSPFELTPEPHEFFTNEGSTEEIWAILISADDGVSGGSHAVMFENMPISDDFKSTAYDSILTLAQKDVLEQASYRFVDLRTDPGTYSGFSLMSPDTSVTRKYHEDAPEPDDAPVIRLGEFYLLLAESLARTGQTDEAIAWLNQIRLRAFRVLDENEDFVPGAVGDLLLFEAGDFQHEMELIEAIIRERRVELAFEGNYFHDLMRLRNVVLNGPNRFSYDADELRFPIPQREIDANDQLEQNPRY